REMIPADGSGMVTPPPLILDRNRIWHGEKVQGRPVFTDTIFYACYSASGAMALDRTPGKIDMAIGPSPPDFTGYLVGKPGITRQSVADGFEAEQAINVLPDDLRTYFASISNRPLKLGHSNTILQYQVVRKEIYIATNSTKMIQNALNGLGTPGDTLMPTSSPLWYAMPPYSPDDKNGDGSPYDFPPFTSIPLEQFPEGDTADAAATTILINAGWAYGSATTNRQTGTAAPLCLPG